MTAIAVELLRGATAFLAVLLLASALHKALDAPRARGAVTALTGLGAAPAAVLAALALFAELAAGAALLASSTRIVGAWAAAALWATYSVLLARAILSGRRDLDCGCSFGASGHRLGPYPLARNAALVATAVTTALVASLPAPSSSQWLPALAALALYAALDQVLAMPGLRPAEAR